MPETRPKDKRPSTDGRFPIVGIGASAGGLRALQSFFDHLPADSGMAFVVIVHLDPNHASQLAELLGSHTSMPVRQVGRRVKAEPDHVYVIPPNKSLSLTDGHLELSARKNTRGTHSPIDLFFQTLAETHDVDAIAIVLSGTGTDGTRGIRSIKERGGITMVQAPAEAEHGEMPRSAIASGQIDIVLPAGELAPEVVRMSRAEGVQRAPGSEQDAEADEPLLGRILAHIRAETKHDFSDYKRSTILRRLQRRMHFRRAESLPEYLSVLRSDPDELRAVFNDFLITVTSFFRDPEAFDVLERLVVPKLFAGKRRTDSVRVWVAGCATGEEAYSLAILLCEHAARLDDPPGFQVFATDVHEQAFAFARDGLYAEPAVADVSPERLERFFSKQLGGYRVKATVREKVLFASHNLLSDPPFLRLDLISCRNLFIYIQRAAQQRVLDVFHYALQPCGHLFLGSTETVQDASRLFAVVDRKARIYESLDVPHPLLHAASRPSRTTPSARTSPGPDRSKTFPFGAVHQQLVEAYAPPSLVVNMNEEIVHLSDRVGKYLQLGGGEPTQKLPDMVRGEITLRLRTLLRKALVKREAAQAHAVRVEVDGKERLVDLIVRPLSGDQRGEHFALVIFDEHDEALTPRAAAVAKDMDKPKRRAGVRQSQLELKETKALLHATLEEHDATVEELKASNEELQSINEEQKATSEELETSKEELQSANEELRTINQEQRNKNEELVRANSDIQNLIDSTDIGTLFLDRDLRIRRYTPAITEIFNFVPSDQGRPISHMTHRLQYEDMVADVSAVLQSRTRLEREVSTADGRWFSVRLSPYRSVDDRIDGVVMTIVDTTARKHAEIERQALLEAAEAASAAKSEFIGVMSHEFRTPLNAIVGYAEILNVGAVGPVTLEQSHHLDRIAASARHLSHMIDDVLTSARAEAGTPTVDVEPLDLVELLREVAAAVEPLVLAKNLLFHLEVTDGSIIIVSDPTKLRQILFNLLGNAVRFTDRGRVVLRLRVDGESVIIEVDDTGIGIAGSDLQHAFERFWQADRSMTSRRGGTGLGLTVSLSLARSLGGDLTVKSELGRGSLFTLQLPLESAGKHRPS